MSTSSRCNLDNLDPNLPPTYFDIRLRPKFPTDLPQNVQEWKRRDVKKFLEANMDAYVIERDLIDVLYENRVSGNNLLAMTEMELMTVHKVPYAHIYRFMDMFAALIKPKVSQKASRRGIESEDSSSMQSEFFHTQDKNVRAARMALSPSSAAMIPAFIHEQSKRPVLNGRPFRKFGPPIGLFHPVFDSFQVDLKELNPDPRTFAAVRKLLFVSADLYKSAADRVQKTNECLCRLLGARFTTIEVQGIMSDGVIEQYCGDIAAYVMFREVKNEIGAGHSDPYNQGSLTYRKFWIDKPQDIIREKTYCPSFILAIAGPWLCVLGAVYNENAIIQPLTDYIWLGGGPINDERLHFLARLFGALRRGINTLKEYYKEIDNKLDNPGFLHPGGYPFIHEFQLNNERVTLTYKDKLRHEGSKNLIYMAEIKGGSDGSRGAEFGTDVIVKFTPRYNTEAHRLLAERNLAPRLLYSSTEDPVPTTYGGLYMIVMEYFKGKTKTGTLPRKLHDSVKEAVELLHSKDLVFGDLRLPNILIDHEKAVLVDFDWCGKAGEARYPGGINMQGRIKWPAGVGPDVIMEKQHDLEMLKKLKLK